MISIVLTFLFLALVTPMVFNFEEYFGVGYYSADNDYRTTYSDGYGEVNVGLQAELSGRDTYSYYISCQLSSSGNVEIVGMTHFNYTVNAAGGIASYRIYDWDPPMEQYTRGSRVFLKYNEYLIWSGSTEVKFISNSIVQNETIDFSVAILIYLNNQDYSNMDLVSYVVFFSWFFGFLVLPLTLKYIIQPQFGVSMDDETRKKQKKYFDFFKESKGEES